jgi:AAA family ATP:ADP antiporter
VSAAAAGAGAAPAAGPAYRLLRRVVEVEPHEVRLTLLACAYFFCSLSSWFVLRPVRDEIAVAAGVRNLPWLFLGTLVVTLLANALYATLVARLPVRRFLLATYQLLALCLVGFRLTWDAEGASAVWSGRVFFAWTTMFAVLVPSVFWSVMADAFRSAQATRLFGFIAVGGTLGSIAGSAVTALLARRVGTLNLLLVSIALLELAALLALVFYAAARRGPRAAPAAGVADARPVVRGRAAADPEARIGGSARAAFTHVTRSPYLLGISGFILLYNFGSTVLYFAQTEVVGAAYADRDARTALLARIELAVQLCTVVTQLFLTGRVIRAIGLSATLALMPAVSIVGFAAIGASGWGLVPALAAVLGLTVLRRASNFALTNPAMETLFTVVSREDKYKAKTVIETFVYRTADQLAAWSYAGLAAAGLGIVGISWLTVPVSVVFLALGLWLGRRHRALAAREEQGRPVVPSADAPLDAAPAVSPAVG